MASLCSQVRGVWCRGAAHDWVGGQACSPSCCLLSYGMKCTGKEFMTGNNVRWAVSWLAAFILTACGAASKPSTQITVTMTDFAFSPNTFTVPAGQVLSFSAVNNGADSHSFVIMKLGHDVKLHFTPANQANVYWEQAEVAPGASVQATLTAPADPGVYQVVCANPGHFEAGMVAKLVVVAP
jgi:uncharacterized cupredoxin-like copper-binding protein